jgi:hypothetical protein
MTTIDVNEKSAATINELRAAVKPKPGASSQAEMKKIVQRTLETTEVEADKLTFCCKSCNNRSRFE